VDGRIREAGDGAVISLIGGSSVKRVRPIWIRSAQKCSWLSDSPNDRRVQDPLMRGEVANRASARIGVPRGDFDRLLSEPSRDRFSMDDGETRPEKLAPPRHDIAILCLLALRHEEAREYLLAQDWREMLGTRLIPNAGPNFRKRSAAGRSGIAQRVHGKAQPRRRGACFRLASRKMPPMRWRSPGFLERLRQAALRRQLQIAEGRMKLPRLTTGEAMALQNKFLTLRSNSATFRVFVRPRARQLNCCR